MSSVLTVPGVYYEPQPRNPGLPFVRTDVAGFLGFEPRVRNGSTPSRLTGGSPPVGHSFQIDITAFTIVVGDFTLDVPAQTDFTLSANPGSTLLADGESVVFGLAGVQPGLLLMPVQGTVSGTPATPSRNVAAAQVRSALGFDLPFERVADVEIKRSGDAALVAMRYQASSARVRNGSTPSQFTGGSPPTGHSFQVDVDSFDLVVGGSALPVPKSVNFSLSANPAATLLLSGESVVFTIIAVRTGPGLLSAPGSIVSAGPFPAAAPNDSVLGAAADAAFGPAHSWRRIADIEYIRSGPGLRTIIRPALPPSSCDDFRDYVRLLGTPLDDGTLLGPAVRAFFANGGGRCWVTTVQRPDFSDTGGLERSRLDMIGIQGAPEAVATGLERLLLIDEVSVIDPVELYARHVNPKHKQIPLPPALPSACFQDCNKPFFGPPASTASTTVEALEPLYSDDDVFDAQREMLLRVVPERWRALLLLTAPLAIDTADGKYHGPTVDAAIAWRQRFFGLAEEDELSCGAMYFPWVLSQEKTGDPVTEMPPTPFAAGVIARRDLARGPHVSPANETVRAVVGLTRTINDDVHGSLYAPPANVNVLRAFPGFGIQVWGARTLSNDAWLRYLAVRRCLSAIERTVNAALQDVVFEPNTPLLWLHITQLVYHVLTPIFDSGALRGDTPEQAFSVRCDGSNNPREAIDDGRLLVEVGVAIAAPAEFIVFRVGRKEGVVEVLE